MSRSRLETTLSGIKPDRPPVSLWRHFPVDDQTPEGLAAAVLNFQRTYDFDFVKVTPMSSYFVRDWGLTDQWRGSPEGTNEYLTRPVTQPDDWAALKPLDPTKGQLARDIQALRLIKDGLDTDTPFIMTIFSPLGNARKLAGEEMLLDDLRRYPDALHAGLNTIAENTQRFVEVVVETGVDGIFFAVQLAQHALLSPEEYRTFGSSYDLQSLEPAKHLWLNLLHIHGSEIMFDDLLDYPVAILNWHDQETPPSLAEAQAKFPGAVCGGLRQWDTMAYGNPQQVRAEAQAAIEATGSQRFILGTGCVTPIIAPHGNLLAAHKSVEA